jgi:hypothetical protein
VRDTAAAEEFRSTVTPVLTVRDAAQAIAFYGRAFGAEEIYRSTYPDGRIVTEMVVEGSRFRVADEAPEASNLSPQALNGTTVRITHRRIRSSSKGASRRPRRAQIQLICVSHLMRAEGVFGRGRGRMQHGETFLDSYAGVPALEAPGMITRWRHRSGVGSVPWLVIRGLGRRRLPREVAGPWRR